MDNRPKLFTKLTIVVFSALGSTFFGSVLYSTNLKTSDKGKFIAPAIIFAIVYTYLANRLTLSLDIPNYYSFIPVHLIGGLFLTGPFWKYQIGTVDSYEKRKILAPALVLIILITLYFVFLFYNKIQKNQSVANFTTSTETEYLKGMENATFVTKDSIVRFSDINLPLIESSYFFKTKVEDVTSFYNYVDYEEGRFLALCQRLFLSDKEAFDLSMFPKNYSFVSVDSLNPDFKSIICADYTRAVNDTVTIKGTVALIKFDNVGYQFMTQYTDLNKNDADDLSHSLINNIFSDSAALAKRKLGAH